MGPSLEVADDRIVELVLGWPFPRPDRWGLGKKRGALGHVVFSIVGALAGIFAFDSDHEPGVMLLLPPAGEAAADHTAGDDTEGILEGELHGIVFHPGGGVQPAWRACFSQFLAFLGSGGNLPSHPQW